MNKAITKPLSTYDIVGFLIPGASFWVLFTVMLFCTGAANIDILLCLAKGVVNDNSVVQGTNTESTLLAIYLYLSKIDNYFIEITCSVFFILGITIIFYITGHILGVLSSIFVERILYGYYSYGRYPCSVLLKLYSDEETEENMLMKDDKLLYRKSRSQHKLSRLGINERNISKSSLSAFKECIGITVKILIHIFLFLPVHLALLITCLILKCQDACELCSITALKVSDDYLSSIRESIIKFTGLNIHSTMDSDFFHIIKLHVMRWDNSLIAKCEYYHAMYGLMRSLSLLFLLAGLCFLYGQSDWQSSTFCFTVTTVCFIQFCKYYRRYSRDILLSFDVMLRTT